MQTLQSKTAQTTAALLEALWTAPDSVQRRMIERQLAAEVPRQLSLRELEGIGPTLI